MMEQEYSLKKKQSLNIIGSDVVALLQTRLPFTNKHHILKFAFQMQNLSI